MWPEDLFDSILRSVQDDIKPTSIAVINLEEAIINVCHKAIYICLEKLDLPVSLIKYWKYIYSHSKTQLSFKKLSHEFFHPVKSVQQGNPLSPLLFILVFNNVIDLLPSEVGFCFKELLINQLAYIDDLVLMAESDADLQHMLNILNLTLENLRLKIIYRRRL